MTSHSATLTLASPWSSPPPAPTQLLLATSANLFILFLFFSPPAPTRPPLAGQPPPLLFTPQHTRSSSEICYRSVVTHLSLRYFGFITLQPVYPEEPQRANTEKRGNGGVQMGGGGAEIQGLLWKNSAEVRLSKSQGLPKATGEGGEEAAL